MDAQPLGAGASRGDSPEFHVRLARSRDEVIAAQELRYRVFFEDGGATANFGNRASRRDEDRFDAICDHLVVTTRRRAGDTAEIVGTYRLLRQEVAARHGGFYSAGEYEIESLLLRHANQRFLELGRSCVLPDYRSRRTIERLWTGIWAYARAHAITAMFGCVSLPGTDPDLLARSLSFLQATAASPPEWSVRAVKGRHVPMGRMAADEIDERAALRSLPPLLRAYLRLGARFGDGAVVDEQFGTTDVFAVLPVEWIPAKYIRYYGATAASF